MDDYRIYLLDGAGRIVNGTDSQCPSDDAARATATAMLGGSGEAEIWQGVRCVGRVAIDPSPVRTLSPDSHADSSRTMF